MLGIGSYCNANAEPVTAKRTILVLGDSISAAYRIDSQLGWVSLLERKLKAERLDWRVVNASVSGATTLDGLLKIDGLLSDFKPQIMILELGANDGLRVYPLNEIRKNLIEIIDRAQAQDVDVLLAGMQLPPNWGPKWVIPFRLLFEEIAVEQDIALIPFLMEGVAGDDLLMQDDGLHPNVEGQPGLLANVWSVLRPYVDDTNEIRN